MLGLSVLYVSSRGVMNDRGGARLTSEESLQAVVDVVPGVIGLGGNCHRQDESYHRRQANARRIASFKSHDHNSSSGIEQDVKQNNPHRLEKSRLFCRRRHRTEVTEATEGVDFAGRSFRWLAACSPSAMAIGDDPGVAPIALQLVPTVERPKPYFFHGSQPAT
jgi:hypothetical protein